jgi:hypothetical protein
MNKKTRIQRFFKEFSKKLKENNPDFLFGSTLS